MFLRCLSAAAMMLLLGGCSGWASERALIPAAERDSIGLSGTYVSDDDAITFSPGDDGQYLVTDHPGDGTTGRVVFDRLREEIPDVEAEGDARAQTYLMEVPWTDGEGNTAYFYQIVTIAGSADRTSGAFKQFKVLCSSAARALAARKEKDLCIFDDYARLRAAAFDALAWYDEARMEVATTRFARPQEAEAMADEAP
jgi:hypothetical protein